MKATSWTLGYPLELTFEGCDFNFIFAMRLWSLAGAQDGTFFAGASAGGLMGSLVPIAAWLNPQSTTGYAVEVSKFFNIQPYGIQYMPHGGVRVDDGGGASGAGGPILKQLGVLSFCCSAGPAGRRWASRPALCTYSSRPIAALGLRVLLRPVSCRSRPDKAVGAPCTRHNTDRRAQQPLTCPPHLQRTRRRSVPARKVVQERLVRRILVPRCRARSRACRGGLHLGHGHAH
jgi:hypothetical protein